MFVAFLLCVLLALLFVAANVLLFFAGTCFAGVPLSPTSVARIPAIDGVPNFAGFSLLADFLALN